MTDDISNKDLLAAMASHFEVVNQRFDDLEIAINENRKAINDNYSKIQHLSQKIDGFAPGGTINRHAEAITELQEAVLPNAVHKV